LVIEHDMPLLSAICDRLVALELGAVIAESQPADVVAHPRVIVSYLGLDEVSINRSGTPGVAAVPLISSERAGSHRAGGAASYLPAQSF
jgi:ABC-type hemin transport system ATPase subunit